MGQRIENRRMGGTEFHNSGMAEVLFHNANVEG